MGISRRRLAASGWEAASLLKTRILIQLVLSVCSRQCIRGYVGELLVPGALCYTLVDLLRQAFWMLAALHERGNCLLSPHFLQSPEFAASMNQ